MGCYKRANYEMSTEMISNSREGAFMAKQEDDISDGKFLKPSNSRQWSGFRNPRIVRVSRSFGGKDRHSKVCTIRGLRDRRIRLSVPTAVQLYDLQDRLGLGQPSKVIDWLLESTKHDIDKLPPLQFPQGCGEFHPQSLVLPYEPSASQFSITPSFIDAALASRVGENQGFGAKSKYCDMNLLSSAKLAAEDGRGSTEKEECIKSTEVHENKYGLGGYGNRASAQKNFAITSESSLPSVLNNAFPYSSYHSDPSLCLSHYGSHGTVSSQLELNNGSTAVPLSMPSGSQLFFCPSVNATVSPIFASYPQYISTPLDSDPRLFNHIQFVSSSSQVLPPSLLPSTYTNSSSLKSFPTQLSAKLVGSD